MTNNKIINWFIPEAITRGQTNLEMARIFVFTHLAGPLIAQPMGVFLYLISPSVTPQLVLMVIGISSFWALPFALRATGSMPLVTGLSFQGLASISLLGTYFYGGFSSPFLPWLIIGLMLGLFYLSKHVAFVISVFAANVTVFLCCVAIFGLPSDVRTEDLRLLSWLSIVAATVYMTWMALYYSRVMALRTELETEAERYSLAVVELEGAQKIAEKVREDRSLFFSKMSHELRTPLNAIIGYSEIMIEDCADRADVDPQTARDLHRINAAGKHLLSLVSQALDTEKIERGMQTIDVRPFRLSDLCDDVVATILPMIEKNGNKFVVDCPFREEMLESDRTKVAQILINLLGNAGKFTCNGTVTMKLRLTKSIADERLVATVSDTGMGIDPKVLPNLFEAYIQADASISQKFGGTGIGLAITRKFCALLGGEIRVTSKLGEGSTFTVDLPARLVVPDMPSATETVPVHAEAA
ncbi:sensor histidine kinase [Phreatobacter sp.]|uniref:sensor histidine kinase n=1 Tax=Phreatobacter sp. TaxID=1966341 RepID=UPI003F720886